MTGATIAFRFIFKSFPTKLTFPTLKPELEEYITGKPQQASKILKIIEEKCYTVDDNVHVSNKQRREGVIDGTETGGKTVLVSKRGWRAQCRLSINQKPNHFILMGISYLLLPFGLSRFYLGFHWSALFAFASRFLGGIGILGIIYDIFAIPSLVSKSNKLQSHRDPKNGFLNKNQLKFISGM